MFTSIVGLFFHEPFISRHPPHDCALQHPSISVQCHPCGNNEGATYSGSELYSVSVYLSSRTSTNADDVGTINIPFCNELMSSLKQVYVCRAHAMDSTVVYVWGYNGGRVCVCATGLITSTPIHRSSLSSLSLDLVSTTYNDMGSCLYLCVLNVECGTLHCTKYMSLCNHVN